MHSLTVVASYVLEFQGQLPDIFDHCHLSIYYWSQREHTELSVGVILLILLI